MTGGTTLRAIVRAALLLLLLGSTAPAQQTARPERARIDPLTAAIAGRVTSETGGPLRGAEVRAISDGGLTRLVTTDSDGRYLARDLPAGTFTLHVSKSGFVPLYFGQRRPFERRSTIRLAVGQRASADVRLPRAGAITGHIADERGEPVAGARVQAFRTRMVEGRRGLQSFGAGDTTDDTGAYRLYGLPPGNYYVTVALRRVGDRPNVPIEPALPGRGAPIFYPGTANRDQALPIAVSVATDARADLQIADVPTARVSGTIFDSSGAPAAGAMISLLSRDMDFVGADAATALRLLDDAGPDGRFELHGVPPGSFILRAQTGSRTSETALLPLTVDGDVAGLTLTTGRPGTVDVTIVADRASASPPEGVRVTVRTSDRNVMTMAHQGPAGGARMSMSLPAASRVMVEGLPDTWAVKEILLDNQDVTDQPVEVPSGRSAALRVVLTDRITEVAGSIVAPPLADPDSAPQATVVVFAADEARWSYPSRFIRTVRAGSNGGFRLSGLPPHQEYRAVAVDYLDEGEETDPEFLRRMREQAVRFSLGEGERRAIDLRLVNR